MEHERREMRHGLSEGDARHEGSETEGYKESPREHSSHRLGERCVRSECVQDDDIQTLPI